MFKFLSALKLGHATNTQIFTNKTISRADITIKSQGKTFNCTVESNCTTTLPVTRDEIGEITA